MQLHLENIYATMIKIITMKAIVHSIINEILAFVVQDKLQTVRHHHFCTKKRELYSKIKRHVFMAYGEQWLQRISPFRVTICYRLLNQ